jgi:hypothetical protein
MKTRDSSTKVSKIKGVAVFAGGLLLLAALHSTGKQTLLKGSGTSPVLTSEASPPSVTRENRRWIEAYGKLPLSFEANEGQIGREVRYVSHGSGYELYLTPQEAVIALQQSVPRNLSVLHRAKYFQALRQAHRIGATAVLRMGLEGANLQAKISGIAPLPGKVNYFLGNKPAHWHTNIPTYSRVRYEQIYPGVDLVFYGNQRNLEYDFEVAPGSDPKAITLILKGARKLSVDSKGDLILSMADGQVIFQKPVLYQTVQGQRKQIEGDYSLAGKQRVTFAVSEYDRTEPLIIDPVLNYSTYLGGSTAGDVGSAIAVDSLGDAFVTGTTSSTTFPTHNGFGAGNAKGVAFVTELNPSGTALLYSTYLGGTGGDFGLGIALDASGNIYVAGETFSTDFPTNSSVTPFKPTSAGAALGTSFITKINPTANGAGQLVYSSYLGGTNGSAPDFANAVAADANGNAYVTGYTTSSPGSGAANFPITATTAFQTTLGTTAGNAFLTKIDTTQNGALSLIYSTYLGGNGADAVSSTQGFGEIGFGLALDSSKNVYIAGTTTSTNFPTTLTALQPTPPAAVAGGTAFVSRIDTTLTAAASLVYSTYLGGNVAEFGTAIAVKPNSTIAYVTGASSSPTFPTFPANTFQTALTTVFPAAFVSLLDTSLPAGTALQYSTLLGGSNTTGFGIQADASGNAYVGGGTASAAFPVSKGAFQAAFATGATGEGFISKLNPGGKGAADLVYSTLFGGSGIAGGPDDINGIAIDTANDVFITGVTFSSSATFPVFPPATATPPAFQTSLPSGDKSAAFVAKLTLIPRLVVAPSPFDFGMQPVGAQSTPQPFTLTNNTNAAVTFTSIATAGVSPAANTDFAVATDGCSPSVAAGAQCALTVTFKPGAAGPRSGTLTFTDTDSSSPQVINLSGTGSPAAPGVGFAPTGLTFGGQLLTTTSAAQTVTLTNTGTAALTINTIAASGDFAETSTGATACPISPMSLAAGTNCSISVTFAPTATGARAGNLTITDNAGGSPHTVSLAGTGWDFTLTAPTTATVKGGSTGSFQVTVTPLGGFNQATVLACTGAPMKSTCVVAPTSVTAMDGMTPQNATVTITTKGMMMPPPTTPYPPVSVRQIVPLLLALTLLLFLFTTRRLRTRMGIATVILILIALAGCNNYNGPKKGTTNLTITATSGSVSKTKTVALTIN